MIALLIDPLFDGTKAAGQFSAMSGVFAGFSFIGAVTLLTTSKDERTRAARHCSSLLLTAFVTLVVASYLWGVISADTTYAPRTAFMQAGGTVALGLGALQMICAVVSMMSILPPEHIGFVTKLYLFVTLLIGEQFAVTLQESLAEADFSGWVIKWLPAYAIAVTCAVLAAEHRVSATRSSRGSRTDGSSFAMSRRALIGVSVCLAVGVIFTFIFQPDSGTWHRPGDVPSIYRLIVVIGDACIYGPALATLALLNGARRELVSPMGTRSDEELPAR